MTVIMLCLVGTAFAIAQGTEEEKPELKGAVSEDIRAIQVAKSLADYGYATDSASALIEAAEILAQVKVQSLGVEGVASGEPAEPGKTPSTKGYTAEQLLADGKALAKNDKTLTKWANEVQKSIKKGTRGAVGGAKYDTDFVYGNNGTISYSVPFYAGQLAEIAVYSLDGRDLDLYVYDEYDHLIEKDTSYNVGAYVNFVPRWTGKFTIVIKNTSRWDGCFELYTN